MPARLSRPSAGRLLAALLLAGSGVVLGQSPAHACSCVTSTTEDHIRTADAVFVGSVDGVAARDQRRISYDVTVERVYKGDVTTSTVRVRSNPEPALCGLGSLRTDRRYLFFGAAAANTNAVAVNSCSGTAPASTSLVRQVERIRGEGDDPTAPPVPPEPEQATFTRVAGSESRSLARTAAPGVALVLAGLLGLFVAGRVGARKD